jgi:hypothetical protein
MTEDEINRIKEDEKVRQKTREDMAKEKSSDSLGGKLWTFLNSGFGLWLLSSVALSTVTFLVTDHITKSTEARRNDDDVRAAESELRTRLGFLKSQVEDLKTQFADDKLKGDTHNYFDQLMLAVLAADKPQFPIRNEFIGYGIGALLSHLSDSLLHTSYKDSEEAKQKAKAASDASSAWSSFSSNLQIDYRKFPLSSTLKRDDYFEKIDYYIKITDEMMTKQLSRWVPSKSD